ncbi:hypothetical protein DFA_03858 [Cavenderia fasciculata]|uniref:SREBP regulating gene protein n=1 Tax=Cavenderia fasciculata TaxID=261658 RepID=F4Q0L3_CACFS|nr:uncharacterized protein DFA_03858 [Cavenderia fasciculata]EGG18364.1 hypothetical protein DFA_03858 [Cavenderia fasciculata]|eukprot:XP_004366268.1 hypothetical protein DFA_03858 [Cavenderia fasciculata]
MKYILITGHIASDYDTLSSIVCSFIIQENRPTSSFFNNLDEEQMYKVICYLPPTQYKHMMDFYQQHRSNILSRFNFISGESPSQDVIDNTSHIIIVDTKKIARLKHIHKILYRHLPTSSSSSSSLVSSMTSDMIDPQLTITVFDHHPDTKDDIQPRVAKDSVNQISVDSQQCGACTSMMINKLKNDNNQQNTPLINLSTDIATIIAMGIYEDTGRLTYNSTNHIDFEAIEYLSRFNLKMDVIRKLGGKSLIPKDESSTIDSNSSSSSSSSPTIMTKNTSISNLSNITLSTSYNNLLQISSMKTFSAKDMTIYENICQSIYTVTFKHQKSSSCSEDFKVHIGEIVFDGACPSLSPIIQTIMEMNKDIKTGIFLAQSPECIIVIGRSSQQKPDINVGEIVSQFGGGGHHHASSATIKAFSLQQVKNMLFLMINSQMNNSNNDIIKMNQYQSILNNQLIKNQEIKMNININNYQQFEFYNEYFKCVSMTAQNMVEQIRLITKEMGTSLYLYGDTVFGIYKVIQKVDTIQLFTFTNDINLFNSKLGSIKSNKWDLKLENNNNNNNIILKNELKIVNENDLYSENNPSRSKIMYIGSKQNYSFQSLVVHVEDKNHFILYDLFNSIYDIKHNIVRINRSNSFINDPSLLFSIIKESIENDMKISMDTKRFIKSSIVKEEIISRLRGRDFLDFLKWVFSRDDFLDILKLAHSIGAFEILSESKDKPFGLTRTLTYYKQTLDWLDSIFYTGSINRYEVGFKCLVYCLDKKFLVNQVPGRLEMTPNEIDLFIKSSEQIKLARKIVIDWVKSTTITTKEEINPPPPPLPPLPPSIFKSMSVEDILVTRSIYRLGFIIQLMISRKALLPTITVLALFVVSSIIFLNFYTNSGGRGGRGNDPYSPKQTIDKRQIQTLVNRLNFQWGVQTNRNSHDNSTYCKYTVQSSKYVVDDQGHICLRSELDSGCCNINNFDRYSCNGCSSKYRCCEEYTYCVSCCLGARQETLEAVLVQMVEGVSPIGEPHDQFDLCQLVCRTSSHSVIHQREYKHPDTKYCYGYYEPEPEKSSSQ